MTTATPALEADDGTIQLTVVTERHFKVPIVFGIVVVLLAALFGFAPRGGVSTFRLGDPTSAVALPDIGLPTGETSWLLLAVLAVLALWAA